MSRLPTIIILAALTVMLSTGCDRRAALQVSVAEAELLEQLTRDPFVRIDYKQREEDGYLTIRTAQGNTTRYYRLMPANDGGGPLVIRWLDESQSLPVAWSEDHLGTGPRWRGPR